MLIEKVNKKKVESWNFDGIFWWDILIGHVTVRSLAPICSSTTSTIFSELICRQTHRARHRQRKKTVYIAIILGPSWLFVEKQTMLPCYAVLCMSMVMRLTFLFWSGCLGEFFLLFVSLRVVTSCGSASLKLCVSKAASPWSQSPSPDSQCMLMELFDGTFVCDLLIGHFDGTFREDILSGHFDGHLDEHFDGTFWGDILMGHFEGTFWWEILMGYFNGTFLWTFYWVILRRHFGGIFWLDILMGHFDGIFWWDKKYFKCTF